MRRNFLLNVLLRDRIHRFIYMSKCCSIISLVLLTGAPLSLSTTVASTYGSEAHRRQNPSADLCDDVSYILPDEWDYSVTDLLHVFLVTFQVFSEESLLVVHALLDQWEVNQRDDE